MAKLSLREVKHWAQVTCQVTWLLSLTSLCEMNLWPAARAWGEQSPGLGWWVEVAAASSTYCFPLLRCMEKPTFPWPSPRRLVLLLYPVRWVKAWPLTGRGKVGGVKQKRIELGKESWSRGGFPRWQLSVFPVPTSFFILVWVSFRPVNYRIMFSFHVLK